MENNVKRISNIALIAAIYFAVSFMLQFMSFNVIQVRVAESLIILAIISKDGIYGMTLGCFITNLIGVMMGFSGFGVLDIVFGTLLTFISAVLAYYLRNIKHTKYKLPLISLMMPVIINAFGLPFIFAYVFHQGFYINVYFIEFVSIFIGQFISCVIIGGFIYSKSLIQINQFFSK